MLPWPPCPGIPEEKFVARPGQRQTGARRTAPRKQRRVHHRGDVIPVLARTVREVEAAARRGRVTPAVRTKFQAAALLLRDERARVQAAAGSDSHRAEQLKRLDGVAAILATTAVQDAGLLALLAEDSGVSDAAHSLKREMLRDLGIEPAREEIAPRQPATASGGSERRVVPQSVVSRQLANPFLAPDFSAVPQRTSRPRRLAGWELLGPLLSSFERADGGAPACMALPAPTARFTPAGLNLCRIRGSWSPRLLPVTGRSCSPMSRVWARRPRRCSPRKRPRPTRCWSSCRTSSRPTGPVRRPGGLPAARPPWCRATARMSTASPISSWSTTRFSTATLAGSVTSASAAWSWTRLTSSRTRAPSARSTSWRSPTASGP